MRKLSEAKKAKSDRLHRRDCPEKCLRCQAIDEKNGGVTKALAAKNSVDQSPNVRVDVGGYIVAPWDGTAPSLR